MACAGTPVSKRRHSDSSSCSPLSVTARRLLVAKCARGGTLVAHSSSWRSEIQSVRETVAARYSGLRLEESKEQQWIVVTTKAPGEHRRRTGMRRCVWDRGTGGLTLIRAE